MKEKPGMNAIILKNRPFARLIAPFIVCFVFTISPTLQRNQREPGAVIRANALLLRPTTEPGHVRLVPWTFTDTFDEKAGVETSVDSPDKAFLSWQVDWPHGYAYAVERTPPDLRTPYDPTAVARVVQIDLSNGQKRSLFGAPDLIGLTMYPDGQHLLVYNVVDPHVNMKAAGGVVCILDVQSGVCNKVTTLLNDVNTLFWIDDHRFIAELDTRIFLNEVTGTDTSTRIIPEFEDYNPK